MIVTEVSVRTVPAVTLKVAEVAPAATVTLAGTFAALVLELDNDTVAPPEGAAEVSVTLPVFDSPFVSVLELTLMLLSVAAAAAGSIVRPAVLLAPEYDAVSVTEVAVLTVPAVIANVAEVDPAATVKLAGTLAAELFELDNDTTAPPEGAAELSVTVPVPDCPLVSVLELTVTPVNAAAAGSMVMPNVSLAPL
ncbi:MAG TPA: hypothetical protein VMB85_18350 [Bryobacteraceae bacterium]|nr:hypothetical protein [Bryobacteraceae bacterium]